MNRAVFLDRDGTINEDVGDFCKHKGELELSLGPDFIANDIHEAAV